MNSLLETDIWFKAQTQSLNLLVRINSEFGSQFVLCLYLNKICLITFLFTLDEGEKSASNNIAGSMSDLRRAETMVTTTSIAIHFLCFVFCNFVYCIKVASDVF